MNLRELLGVLLESAKKELQKVDVRHPSGAGSMG